MASPRYTLNIKPEDLQPEQPKHEMTGKEKRENFWFYHKWHVIVGIVAALMVFSFVWEIATQVHPDYTIGILTTTGVPMGTGEALAEQLKPYFDDRNGDGEVVVSVMEYTIGKDADSIADPNVQMANITKLSGDIDGGESMLFLVDDMEYFQEQYMLFAYNDGTSPAEGEKPDYARMGVRWGDCPALTSLELGASENFDGSQGYDYQTFLQDYKLGPRVYTGTKLEKDEDAAAYYEKAMSVFHTLTRQ